MRWLALTDDPIAGGTKWDDIDADPEALIAPVAGDGVVVTTAQADPGLQNITRDDNITGVRAGEAPISFASQPSMTFESLAWTSLSRKLVRNAMGGAIAHSGGPDPAPFQDTVQMAQSGNLPALIGTLLREEQVDRMTGLWVDELTGNFPADGEGTFSGTLRGLYHAVDELADVAGLPNIAGNPAQRTAYMLRDIKAYQGAASVPVDCLGGFGFTINNNLSTDFRTRFCAGENIWEATIDGLLHRLWYPKRNRIQRQTVTGRLDFGDTRPDRELRRMLAATDKIVVELAGDPLGTVPPADEMLRLVFYRTVLTDGGADPLTREGDQQSSYTFTAYLDSTTGKDVESVFVGAEALA